MSDIKNTNQKVKNSYYTNFTNIFGEKDDTIPATGTYAWDSKNGKMIKIDTNIPKSVKDKMEPLTSSVSNIQPVSVIKKGVTNAD
jgi:hypothetical protein